jgi:hypothetical protein
MAAPVPPNPPVPVPANFLGISGPRASAGANPSLWVPVVRTAGAGYPIVGYTLRISRRAPATQAGRRRSMRLESCPGALRTRTHPGVETADFEHQ